MCIPCFLHLNHSILNPFSTERSDQIRHVQTRVFNGYLLLPLERILDAHSCSPDSLDLWHMVLGPSSSRLVESNPIFVKQIQVKEEAKKGVFIYEFDQRPPLSLETNWSVSKYMIVGSYSHQGFSLWLNKGSKIHLKWEAPSTSLDNLQIAIIKGERDFETLSPTSSASSEVNSSNKLLAGQYSYLIQQRNFSGEQADYYVLEDDRYYVSVVNTNRISVVMTMNVNVSSRMYDTSNASSVCSTMSGSCKLNLLFPSTRFVILTTPNNVQQTPSNLVFIVNEIADFVLVPRTYVQADFGGWYIELSFVSRIMTYVAILGLFLIIIFVILKYLGACNGEDDTVGFGATTHEVLVPRRDEQSESDPLMPEKQVRFTYGTGDEDLETGSSNGSSDELYDGKICVICYDESRNCFFVPCGHCATCYDCAQRIIAGENTVCPICRRLIHKVRKLFTS